MSKKDRKAKDIGKTTTNDFGTGPAAFSKADEIIKEIKKDKELNKLVINPETMKYEWLNTNVISLNLVFSGKIRGGIKKGAITSMAADSQLGKSLIGYNLLQCAYRSGMACVVIDTEHAINLELLKQLGIDLDKIVIYQTSKINELKQIFARINKGKTREESMNTFVLMDSWGPIVEVQVMEKAEEASAAVNMSGAKFKNELANIINEAALRAVRDGEHLLERAACANENRADAAGLDHDILIVVLERLAEEEAEKTAQQHERGVDDGAHSDHMYTPHFDEKRMDIL